MNHPAPSPDRRGHDLRRTEDLYRLLVENVRDYAIFVLDPEGRVTSWNGGAERIKGYTEEEILGRHYSIFYPEETAARGDPDRQLEEAAATGRFEGEGWRLRKDGTRFWAHVVITALYHEGQLVGFGKVSGDKTAEREAQEALRRRERQLAEAQHIARLGSWEWWIAEDRVEWSDELYRIFGVEQGRPVDFALYSSLLHPEDREQVQSLIRRAVENGEPFSFEHRAIRADDRDVRHIQSRGELVKDDEGRPARLIGTALDVTEPKRAQERERRLEIERAARAKAERTAERMSFLAEASALLGASLEFEETMRTVARLAVPHFADWCAVDIKTPDGRLERLAITHVDPERARLGRELQERYPPDPGDESDIMRRVLRTGEPELIIGITPEMLEAAARDEAHLEILRGLGLSSAIIVPIRLRERVLGVISFVDAESGRGYEEDDLVVAEELAGRAALAIENAQLHGAERLARSRAERARERMSRLQAITAGLSEAVTAQGVAEVIVGQAVAALGAANGVLALMSDTGTLEVIRAEGLAAEMVEQFGRFDREADVPIAAAIRNGRPVLVETIAERDQRFPGIRELRAESGTGAMAAVPLVSGSRVIGGLAFGWEQERSFEQEDRDLLVAVGRQCAQALERAWLFETEHEAREAAEAASRAKTQFLAMMSHELRTPLAAIIGYQELLSEGIVGPVTDRQKEQLARIRASATHLRDLINQILSLSRIEAGKEEVLAQDTDLAELTRDVVLLMEREAEEKGLSLEQRLPDGPVDVVTDPGKVRQILLNLVSNGIKFTDQGAVTLEMDETAEGVVIRVTDTGIGIDPDDRDRVFDAFTQVDQSMTRRAGGSGLGLPVSRRLARLLGGDLELAPPAGGGSTFIVTLPREAPPAPAAEATEAAESPGPDAG